MVRPTESEPAFVYTPAVDIFDAPDALVLVADVPGVAAETLDVCIQDNVLWIHGRTNRTLPEGYTAVYEEAPPSDFVRSFILSDEVDCNQLRAELDDGVLRLTLPKPAPHAARPINAPSPQ
jgi:HSP20 family molecular chaperone IbpA